MARITRRKLLKLTGAGALARVSDADYLAAGATVAPDMASALAGADIVLKVRSPEAD